MTNTTLLQAQFKTMVEKFDKANAEYILNDHDFLNKADMVVRFQEQNKSDMVDYTMDELQKFVEEYNSKNLTPANSEVGQGVTISQYSDAHAYTVIKKTKTTLTLQRDTATISEGWKPEMVVGGFAAHCTNQNTQAYTYEQNPSGEITTVRWSKKFNQYREAGSRSVHSGRYEFYDYNF